MYLPLDIAHQLNVKNMPDDYLPKPYLEDMVNGNDELFSLLSESTDFGKTKYDGPYKELSDFIYDHWVGIFKWATGGNPKKFVFNKPNRAIVLDALTNLVMVSKWNKLKRVYRFDPELELALATVDEVKIPLKTLYRLPFKTFYVEFAEDGIFTCEFNMAAKKARIHGVFVDVLILEDKVAICLTRTTEDAMFMCGAGIFDFDPTDKDPIVTISMHLYNIDHSHDTDGFLTDWEEFSMFITNAIVYLCASNAEVREVSPKKPSAPAKNKKKYKHKRIAEPVICECGYIFGETIRFRRKQAEATGQTFGRTVTGRKSPRPHAVKASWQHYWKGSGLNKERVLVFKEAYFTGSGDGTIPYATINKVVEA